MQEQSNFGALLRRYRLSAGLSQEALAARARLSARTISDLERGIHGTPHLETLALLASALSLSSQQHALLLAAARPEVAAAALAPVSSPSPGLPLPPPQLVALLATKLHVPRPRRQLVARPVLIKRVQEGVQGLLTLVSA